jgi:acetolactate synthase-1/2/3 large subunit
MHGCDVMLNIGRALRRPHDGAAHAFSPGLEEDPRRHRPSSINKNVKVDVPIVGDAGRVLAALIEA